MEHAVKMIDSSGGRVGGYLVVWGDDTQRDLEGEYFTPETEFGLAWYAERPMLYQHGLDPHLKAAVIGQIDMLQADDVGIWAEAQLDIRHRYIEAVRRLIEKGVLAWSSGSLPHLVDVAKDGHIKRWIIVEGSLTPTPAEPRRTDVRTIKSAYHALGLDMSRLGVFDDDIIEGKTPMETTPIKRLPIHDPQEAVKGRIEVLSEFDSLDEMDMLHGFMMMSASKNFKGVSERYANAMAHKITRAGLVAGKSDELSNSAQTAFGGEWVTDMWSSQIWQKARQDNVILPLFRAIEMPSSPFELPIEGTDPTVYYVPETTHESQLALESGNSIPDSKVGSGKVQLNAKKLALRVGFSAELVEDAILPVLNVYREQAVRAIADSIDYVLLNGDTTTSGTGNINTDAAAPSGTDRFLAFDGLRKLALANHGSASSSLSLAELRAARFAMPARYAARPADLAWIVDSSTYSRLLGLSEFLTVDKAGALATAQTGQIGFMDGIPVFNSAQMPLTEAADGKVNLSGTNDQGTALCVYRPGWFVGYRRKIAVNVDYLPYYDSYQLTATVRLAFANFDTDVASALYAI